MTRTSVRREQDQEHSPPSTPRQLSLPSPGVTENGKPPSNGTDCGPASLKPVTNDSRLFRHSILSYPCLLCGKFSGNGKSKRILFSGNDDGFDVHDVIQGLPLRSWDMGVTGGTIPPGKLQIRGMGVTGVRGLPPFSKCRYPHLVNYDARYGHGETGPS